MKLYYDGRGSKHSRDQTWLWRSLPDTTKVFEHQMNLYGFRDEEWYIKKDNEARALFIGDSFIEGVMAAQGETIPDVFEKASDNTVEAFNGGMLGCGMESYLQLTADMIPIYKPDVAFLCIYANDLGKKKPIIPEFYLEPEYYNTFKPRLLEIIDQVNTYGALRFRAYKDKQLYLPAVPHKGNPWSHIEDSLTLHVKPWIGKEMKMSRFNPFLTNALHKEEQFLKRNPLLGESLNFFKYICEENKVTPVIVYIPSRNQVTDYYLPFEKEYCIQECDDIQSLKGASYRVHQNTIKEQCDFLKISFIDFTSIIETKEQQGEHLYWNYDQHMRVEGYQLIGETLWEEWKQLKQH